MRKWKISWQKPGIIFGIVFGFFYALGKNVQQESVGRLFFDIEVFRNFIFTFCLSGVVAGIFAVFFYQILENASSTDRESVKKQKGSFSKTYFCTILCYLLCFIAYYPGIMSYDSWYITLQALGKIGFDNHHPFLHTLIWSMFARLDDFFGIKEIGIVFYTLVQFMIMTAIYAWVYLWICGRNKGKAGKVLSFLYLAFNPVFHIFTLILTKDVYFSGCFLLLTVRLIDLCESILERDRATRKQGSIIIISLLCCLFRNNMIYVIILLTVVIFFMTEKRIASCKGLLISIFLYGLIVQVIYPSIGVSEGSIREMMSVPLSQISAVYQNEKEELNAEEKELILKYIPDVEQYDRFFADNVKSNFNTHAFHENKEEFIFLWYKLFRKYPGEYAQAFLTLNLPYWYPEMNSVREYIETDNYSQDYPVIRKNLLPSVYHWYEEISENRAKWMTLPVFRQLYSIGMPIWILLFFLIRFIVLKKRAFVCGIMPAIFLWLTYLMGPVSSFRYIEPLLLTYPVWVALSLERKSLE